MYRTAAVFVADGRTCVCRPGFSRVLSFREASRSIMGMRRARNRVSADRMRTTTGQAGVAVALADLLVET
jgi:hypothetical protein